MDTFSAVEAKFGKTSALGKRRHGDDDDEDASGDSEDSSEDEDEDEDGELVTETLDAQIQATLNAIRSKDPRVYDTNATFYTKAEETAQPATASKKEKPMFLKDYHRENLLKGTMTSDDTEEVPKTYAQEQEILKNAIIKEMHAADGDEGPDEESGDDDEDGGFLVPKATTTPIPSAKDVKLDVENADKDPEAFLSNFMAAKAWIPSSRADLVPFESDDEEEDARAEAFEESYNFRFEDPNKINEKLITHSRDATAQISVRREEKSARKKQREAEGLKKEQEKKQREMEKNRLRKLKIEELQEKVRKVKEVAGLRASEFTDEDWARFLDGAWDDRQWEAEMQKRFGDDYYAQADAEGIDDEEGEGKSKKKRPKKPTWDDDIDITDLVPDFDEQEKPELSLSDVEMADGDENDEDEDEDGDDENESGAQKKKKSKAQEKRERRREARKERMRIEEAVDRNLDLDITLLPGATKKNSTRFRYRETSPQSFGLTARDILMADDSQLNQFAGLKKLAAFRDPEKKRRDQKKLGKRARLREWRREIFGNEDGPTFQLGAGRTPRESVAGAVAAADKADDHVDIRDGSRKKKRKRSKKH